MTTLTSGLSKGADPAVDALVGSTLPARAGMAQAGTVAWAEKIDSWDSSGSITPMIF